MKVLIMDMTHGGAILAERFIERGDKVTCVDVYRIAKNDLKDRLKNIGVRITETVPQENYDISVAPMHCPDAFLGEAKVNDYMSFSRAVNLFCKKGIYRIEVTGVKGKTSTCYILAHILQKCGKKVFLHTSRGDGPWTENGHIIESQRSIAPTSILELPDSGYDITICEVSLGGSGKADIAVVTNLIEDYGIAKNTRKASQAKSEIFTSEGINVIKSSELDIWSSISDKEFITFDENIEVEDNIKIGKSVGICFTYKKEKITTKLDAGYMSLQYIPSIDAALKIFEVMDVPKEKVVEGLTSFRGVPGRGEIVKNGDIWCICDKNPGVSHISADMTLSCLKKMNSLENVLLIVDPINKKVCDKMDIDLIKKVAMKYNVPVQFTDGCGSVPEIPKSTKIVVKFTKEGFQ
ncbi:MAG: coenzyme F430 synthase [archaeon]|nr:coenzyme F430 synthase [archaeon]